MGIIHVEVYYTATLHAVLLCSTMSASRVTLVVTIGTTGNFKVYTRDFRAKLCKVPLSIKNDISSPPILPYKYSNPT